MQFVKIGAVLALIIPLAGCLENDAERAVAGAAAGAVIANATDNDIATGAVVGAGAGVFCDDLGICRRSR